MICPMLTKPKFAHTFKYFLIHLIIHLRSICQQNKVEMVLLLFTVSDKVSLKVNKVSLKVKANLKRFDGPRHFRLG